jgi:hypothetical protein
MLGDLGPLSLEDTERLVSLLGLELFPELSQLCDIDPGTLESVL